MSGPILISAFEPFDKSTVNASEQVARRLSAANPDILLHILPVERFRAAVPVLERLQHAPAPRFYLALGEAGPENVVRLEKVAINWDDFRIPDNSGNQPSDESIIEGGPTACFATIPVAQIVRTLHEKTPVPVQVSLSAGSFVCNHLAYTVSVFLTAHPVCPFCFVHLPSWRPNDEYSERTLADIVTTLQAIITTIAL